MPRVALKPSLLRTVAYFRSPRLESRASFLLVWLTSGADEDAGRGVEVEGANIIKREVDVGCETHL